MMMTLKQLNKGAGGEGGGKNSSVIRLMTRGGGRLLGTGVGHFLQVCSYS